MSDDLRTIETMQENAEHFGDVVARVANALTRNAPHVYAPESDDMTVEFAIQLAEKDEKIEQQARRITQWEMAYGELLEEREIKNGQIAALRSAQEWQDISTAPEDDDFLVWHRDRIRQVSLYDPPGKDIIPLNTVIDAERGRMWVATHWMPCPKRPVAVIAEERTDG